MRFALVHTPMVVPTDNYEDRRELTPEQAAERVVRALEDRPLTVDTWVGRAGELLNIVAPRFSDALMSRFHRGNPDSAAAARHASAPTGSQHGHRRDDTGHDDAGAQGGRG
jgi:hypothetical protein